MGVQIKVEQELGVAELPRRCFDDLVVERMSHHKSQKQRGECKQRDENGPLVFKKPVGNNLSLHSLLIVI